MEQTYEYYVVNPDTWKDVDRLTNIKSCTINRDSTVETLGSATFDITGSVGECYIRVYLITVQNGVRLKHPLGTFLAQTPSSSFDGMVRAVSMDAYTPLLELKEKSPPLGYSLYATTQSDPDVLGIAAQLARENMRAPVVPSSYRKTLDTAFVSNTDDTWLTFLSDLIATAKYKFDLDELGRLLFTPHQEIDSLQPIWTYTDDNSSILHADISMEHDLFGIPNVVEVIYSGERKTLDAVAKNNDPTSPTSIQNRGREIVHRITDPGFPGIPSQAEVQEYADRALKDLSSIEYSISYTHGYCPVRVGDCVRMNYKRSGIVGVKAKIISQSISCEPGCPVSEKAVFTTKLWR